VNNEKRKLFVCLDGYRPMESTHFAFYHMLFCQLCKTDHIVTSSSMGMLGEMKHEEMLIDHVELFHVLSWTKEEYMSAIQDDAFYQSVKVNLDTQQVFLSSKMMLNDHEEDIAQEKDDNAALTPIIKHCFPSFIMLVDHVVSCSNIQQSR